MKDCCARWSTCKWNGKRMSPLCVCLFDQQSQWAKCGSAEATNAIIWLQASKETRKLSVRRKWSRNHHHHASHSLVHSSLITERSCTDHCFLVHTEKMVHRNYYLPRMRLFSVCKVSRSRTFRCVCSACRTGIILLIIQEPLVAGPVLHQSTIHSSQQLHCLPWNVHSQKDIFEIVSRQKAARRYSESELLFYSLSY